MIITCPNCSKRYMLDEALLPEEGRQVRCIACYHVWHQAPAPVSPPPRPPFESVTEMTMDAPLLSRKPLSWLGWIIGFAILFSLLSFLSFGRDSIVKIWPQTERFYDLIGLHTTLPGAGLSIANATSLIHQDDTIEMIQVAGDIINISDQVRSIPALKIKLMGEKTHPACLKDKQPTGCVLDYWEHRLSESSLLPGEQIHFETDPRPKVNGTQRIVVEF